MDGKRERAFERYVGEVRLLAGMCRVCDAGNISKEAGFGEVVGFVDGWTNSLGFGGYDGLVLGCGIWHVKRRTLRLSSDAERAVIE